MATRTSKSSSDLEGGAAPRSIADAFWKVRVAVPPRKAAQSFETVTKVVHILGARLRLERGPGSRYIPSIFRPAAGHLDRTFFRNRVDGCRQDLCGGVTKSGARDRDGEGGRGWDAAGTSVVTAVANMPELAFGNAQVRRQEASGESRGTVLTLHRELRLAAHCRRNATEMAADEHSHPRQLDRHGGFRYGRITYSCDCLPLRGS